MRNSYREYFKKQVESDRYVNLKIHLVRVQQFLQILQTLFAKDCIAITVIMKFVRSHLLLQ